MKHFPIGDTELQTLNNVAIFSQLPPALLQGLFENASGTFYESQTDLFMAGDPADGFYILLSGEVHLTILTADGAQSLVRIVEPGESFAEAAMLGLGEFPINGTAMSKSAIVKVSKSAFEKKISSDPEASLHLLSALIKRQQFLISEIKILKSLSPCQRVASKLLSLYESQQWKGSGSLPRCKQTMASNVGIDPASFSRVLRRLEDAGIVCEGQEVIITDPEKLRQYCAGFGYVFDDNKLLMSA
ncbi:Crp/Fnr family transcriptional regulator [Kiloniella litopenaei]|uniref:Crp/Fnr family transcriptional regulator n=1 Tax=Kiloniella litopenaei TaxID=1549748 RepID=UPI000697B2A8|nr:Crp/Fnr family transcriptional regulator [Kiloniella litopenaei]